MGLQYQQNTIDTKICEICGVRFIAGYGYSLAACWLVTGHAYVGAFMCDAPGGQHWGCCPDHAVQACFACIKEHLHPQLIQKHQDATDKGHPRTAVEDAHLLSQGKDFHIIKEKG